jgi:hypothetical protein
MFNKFQIFEGWTRTGDFRLSAEKMPICSIHEKIRQNLLKILAPTILTEPYHETFNQRQGLKKHLKKMIFSKLVKKIECLINIKSLKVGQELVTSGYRKRRC